MGAIIVLTPALIAAWPTVSASVVGAAAAMGFAQATAGAVKARPGRLSVELEVEGAEVVADAAAPSQRLVFERDGVTVSFERNARGGCQVKVHGDLPRAELEALGEEFAGQVVQQFAYQQLVGQLEQHGFGVVEQEVEGSGTIQVRVRRFS